MTGGSQRQGRTGEDRNDAQDRSRDRGFLLAAAAALAMVLTVLLNTVLSPSPSDGSAAQDTRDIQQEDTRAGQAPHQPATPSGRTAAPKPERCRDGRDPAASLRPEKSNGATIRRIDERGYLKVGVDQNSYRWSSRSPHSRDPVGFDIDLVKAIAKDLLGPHARIAYKAIPTDQRIEALRNNDVDLVVRTMTINCERIEKVAFSTAYFEAGQQMLVPERSRITGYDSSVKGHRLCTARGSTGETELRKNSFGAKIILVSNQLDCLVQLQLGTVDGVVTDNALAAGQAAQDPSVELVGKPFTLEPYGVAMNKKNEDLVRRVNHVLDDFRDGGASSQWQRSYDKWLGDVLDDDSATPPKPAYRD